MVVLDVPMTAIEMTGTIDEPQQLKLDSQVPIMGPRRVRVIVLSLMEGEWGIPDEIEWLHAASRNPVFGFLSESGEDIYSLEDGQPFDNEI